MLRAKALLTGRKGISMVEILVAAAITLIAAISVMGSVFNNIDFAFQADKVYRASLLAQARVDALKSSAFSDIPVIGPETDTALDVDNDGTVDFYRTTVVTQSYANFNSLIKIKVSVYRTKDGQKLPNPVVMETLLSLVEMK